MDLGFERAGFRVGLAYDIREKSIQSWNRNRPDNPNGFCRDVTKLQIADFDTDYGKTFTPSGVIGGPPCQSFSKANTSKINNDPRDELVEKFVDIALMLDERQPLQFVVMENVPELANVRKGTLLQTQLLRLRNAGFDIHTKVLDALHFGTAQRRKRLFVVGLKSDASTKFDWLLPTVKGSKGQTLTVRNAIWGLPEPTYFRRNLKPNEIEHHPNHWCMQPKSSRFTNRTLRPGETSMRSFKTLQWDKPSITASYGNREVHVHPNCRRRLSVFEAMLIQGFSESYVLDGTLSDQITQVSEAVPPPLALAVAKLVIRCMPIDHDGIVAA